MLQKSKVFKAKTFESALKEACEYFSLAREDVDVTIIQDAKSGIFGIVPIQDAEIKVSPLSRGAIKNVEVAKELKPMLLKETIGNTVQKPRIKTPNDISSLREKPYSPMSTEAIMKMTDVDIQAILSTVQEVIKRILAILVQEIEFSVELQGEEVHVYIPTGDNDAVLIGKDHENILAIQHIVSRILSQQTQCAFSVIIHVGDVISSEENMLISMALRIAEKVKISHKTQQTLPLPGYQRRIIHITLQDDPLIGTTTKGSDILQPVVIFYQKKHQEKAELDINSVEE